MATGRIGVTPTLRTRWSKLPTTGTTVLSGLDDNSVALVYDAGYEAVYRNGVLLSRGNDYTATDGTTVTLIDATLATDIIEIFANDLVPLTDAISKGQYNAKGALLSATAASTPAVLAVGTNDQVLTADSSTSTGLKWATASAGGMTLLATIDASAATTVSFTSISSSYKHLLLIWKNVIQSATGRFDLRFNNDSGTDYQGNGCFFDGSTVAPWQLFNSTVIGGTNNRRAPISETGTTNTGFAYKGSGSLWVYDYTNIASEVNWSITSQSTQDDSGTNFFIGAGMYNADAAVDRIDFIRSSTQTVTGQFKLYGVS
jgi:hypothetical protein